MASASVGSGPSSVSRWPRRGPPFSAAACWWRWRCWPSTEPSRSCGTRPSPRRSSPSSSGDSTLPPPVPCRSSSSCSVRAPHRRRLRARQRTDESGRSPGRRGPGAAPVGSRHGAGGGGLRRGQRARSRRSHRDPRLLARPRGPVPTLPAAASLSSAAWHSAGDGAGAAALATVAALPVALLSVRYPGRTTMMLERSTYLVLALPGVVIALSCSCSSPSATPPSFTSAVSCSSPPTPSCSSLWPWWPCGPRWRRPRRHSRRWPGVSAAIPGWCCGG